MIEHQSADKTELQISVSRRRLRAIHPALQMRSYLLKTLRVAPDYLNWDSARFVSKLSYNTGYVFRFIPHVRRSVTAWSSPRQSPVRMRKIRFRRDAQSLLQPLLIAPGEVVEL
jgi:hypothetical protein